MEIILCKLSKKIKINTKNYEKKLYIILEGVQTLNHAL
jgi:hypothetical protein